MGCVVLKRRYLPVVLVAGLIASIGLAAVGSASVLAQGGGQDGGGQGGVGEGLIDVDLGDGGGLAYPVLGARLSALADQAAADRLGGVAATPHVPGDTGNYAVSMIGLSITFDGDSERVIEAITAIGGDVRNVFDGYIEAFVPPAALSALAQVPGLTWAREFAVPHKNRGRATSGGVAAHLARAWHRAGFTGGGVKIGVIDGSSGTTTRDGFWGLRSAMASGDLPATVVGRCYTAVALATSDIDDCASAGDDHGLYVAATVMDVAPDADLYISNPHTWGDLQQSAEWMKNQGVQVIVYSAGWTYHGAADGTSPINPSPLNTVKWAADNGIVWVNSAGNTNGRTWFGAFTDTDNDNIHEWTTAGDEYQEFTPLYPGETTKAVFMRWDDAWGTASTDLALLVVKNPGTAQEQVVDNLNDEQKGGPNSYPYEYKQFTAPDTGTYAFVVKKVSGATPGWIQVATVGSLAHTTSGHSVFSPADSPHAGMLGVGAASTASSGIRSYSSRGPTPDGRVKPDIVGADGYVSVGLAKFGTSYAAPHVAGLAALVRQQSPEFTAAQTAGYLKAHAVPRGSPSPDNTWGHGFAQLPPFDCVGRLLGDGTVSGAWTSGCMSAVHTRKSSRFYTFAISQQSTVTIDLSSGVDSYLYLRNGYNSQKGVALHTDDNGGTGTDARISESLAAGTYTIEATTASAGQTGSFTLAVSGGLTEMLEVSISAGPDITEGGNAVFTLTATPAPPTALTARVEITADGKWGVVPGTRTVTIPTTGTATLTLATYNDSTEEYNGSVTARLLSDPAYVVDASAPSVTVQVADHDGGDPDSCLRHLTADGSYGGSWSSDCASRERENRYARFYTLQLTERSTVTIDLKSSSKSAYLYLRSGKGVTRGQALYENDHKPGVFWYPEPGSYDALIRESLPAGWYTIEATTVRRRMSGSFTLVVSGLPAPEVSIAAGSGITEGGDAVFTVSADPAPTAALDVTVAVAVSGDFGVSPGSHTVTVPASGSVTLTVATADDSADEADGSVTATLSSGQGYTVSATAGAASVAVADDDDPPCDAADAISRARAAFAWHVDNNGGNEVVFWQVLAYLGADPLPAPPGGGVLASTTPEAVRAFSDGKTWPGWVPINAAMGCHPPPPEVSITAGADVGEGGDAVFTVSADPAPTAALDVTVAVTVSGDFGVSPGSRTVTVPTSGSVTLTVATTNDAADEADGSVTATVGAGSGYTVSATAGAAAVAVRDDDVPEVSIAAGADIDEGGSASFTVTADPAPTAALDVTVAVTTSGDFGVSPGSRQVTVPTTGTATLTVATTNDAADEADGSVTATVGAGSGYTVSATAGTAAVAVRDDDDPPVSDPVVSITAGSGISEGGDAVFTVSAVPAPAAALDVTVSVSQTGDYGITGGSRQVTIPASGTATLTVATANDSADEADGSVTATIGAGTGYTISATAGSATVAVSDDDDPAPVGDPCVAALSGDGSVTGQWAAGCGSSARAGRYARFYTFSLDSPSRVTIDLESTADTFMYLRRGAAQKSGAAVVSNDDGGDGYNSRISRHLAAGDYTIEATTYRASTAGSFTLTVEGIPTQTAVQPDPEVSVTAGADVTEGGDAVFTVTASPTPAAALDVTVAVTVSGDFGVPPGSHTVTVPTSGTATLTVATTNDSTDEADGSVTATLNTGSGYTVSASSGSASVAVSDDDDPPPPVCVPSLPSDAVTVSEVTGWRDQYSHAEHQQRWNRVLAALGTDTGETAMTVADAQAVKAQYDNTRWDRTVRTLQAMAQCDDPPPAVTPEVSITGGAGVTEGGDAIFTITADPAPTAPLTVTVSVAQTGDFGVTTGPQSVTVPTSGSVTLSVATADDSTDEPNGSVTTAVSAGAGYTVSATAGSASVAVADDDDPPPVVDPEVSITAGADIDEGGDAVFTVTASPAPAAALTVTVSVSQTGDYGITGGSRTVTIPTTGSATLTVATTNDTADEADGSVTATISAGSGYTVSATAGTASVAVSDDDDPPPPPPDPEVSIAAGAGITEGGDAAFTVTASPAPSAALTVTVSVSQSGDYGAATGSRTVTIPTTGSATLTVATTGDSADEADGSVTATVGAGQGYTVSATAGSASVAVADDDDPPPPPVNATPSLSISDASGAEGGTLTFTVTLSPSSGRYAWVHYYARPAFGTAASATFADFAQTYGMLTFEPGDTTKTITVALVDDNTPEANETFKLVLYTPAQAAIADGEATGTITDND